MKKPKLILVQLLQCEKRKECFYLFDVKVKKIFLFRTEDVIRLVTS